MSTHNKRLGDSGERQAQQMLKELGYEILHCNYRTKRGEIDIVARDVDTIVFVEVKTRTTDKFGRGAQAVGETKINRIKEAALEYAYEFGHEVVPMRIDVVEIQIDSGVTHYINITV